MTASYSRWWKRLLLILCMGLVTEITLPTEAEARAGRGRSMGRSGSFGRPPARQFQRKQTPPTNNGSNMQNQPSRGNFMRGLAGGLAGGFLGSMLFSSLGFGAGGAGGAGAGGGMGFLEIALLAGAIYFGFRWWKSRQQGAMATNGQGPVSNWTTMNHAAASQSAATSPVSAINSDEASDIFFRVQGAWTRRDLSSVRDVLGKEVEVALGEDLDELRRSGKINRLENISVRDVNVGEGWGEDGVDFSTVRFTANMLDYTVDEKSDAVVQGSNTMPVKFEEDWTFARGLGSKWQLVGIEQVQ